MFRFQPTRGPWWLLPMLFAITPLLSAQVSSGALLKPTGAWGVGRAAVEVVDSSRTMPNSSVARRLMLQVWYPTTSVEGSVNLPYIEHLEGARDSLTNDELDLLKTVQTHSFAALPASPPASRFPLLLFSHGEQMNAFLYSNLHEELASHGFIVVAVEHPGAALFVEYPDGSVVAYSEPEQSLQSRVADRVADLRFVRDQIGRLEVRGRRLKDLMSNRIGVFGHSTGGMAAVQLCQQPPLLDACLNMDGRLDAAPIMTGAGIPVPSRPFMYMTKPFRTLTDSELRAEGITRDQAATVQAETWARDGRLLSNTSSPSYRATFHQAEHASFSDEPLLRDPDDASREELMKILRGLTLEFFEATVAEPLGRSVAARSTDDIQIEILATQRKP